MSTNGLVDKENMVYIYAIEFYSPVKKNGIMAFAGKLVVLEIIVLSKISQTNTPGCLLLLFSCIKAGRREGPGTKREDIWGTGGQWTGKWEWEIKNNEENDFSMPCVYMEMS